MLMPVNARPHLVDKDKRQPKDNCVYEDFRVAGSYREVPIVWDIHNYLKQYNRDSRKKPVPQLILTDQRDNPLLNDEVKNNNYCYYYKEHPRKL